jgi:hypothetical protein
MRQCAADCRGQSWLRSTHVSRHARRDDMTACSLNPEKAELLRHVIRIKTDHEGGDRVERKADEIEFKVLVI